MENNFTRPFRQLMLSMLCLILTCGISWPLMAQHSVKGLVKDQNGEAVIGANVLVKGSQAGTITDIEGNFELNVQDANATLVFTFVGFKQTEVALNGRSFVEVTMQEDVQSLEELVVVGYGVKKKKVVTGAIASVDAEQIKKTPVLRAEQALQGRTAGVQVTSTSGQPGAGLTVRVRGAGTTGNPDPLYLVDGIPMSNIDYLNPSDIESIDVLKDAASAAIYGARAANGVVLISTKSGVKGKPQFSYDMYAGLQNPWKKLPVLDAREYVVLKNEAAMNAGQSIPFPDVNLNEIGEGTDWQDELFNYNAPITNHNFSLTGGGEHSTFATSFSYFSQEGIVGGDKSKFDRYSFRINGKHDISDRFKVGHNLSYTRIENQGVIANSEFGSPLSNALNMDPLTPVYETDSAALAGYPANAVQTADGRYYGMSSNVGQEIVNPLARLETIQRSFMLDKLVGNAYAEFHIIEGLKAKSDFAVDIAYGKGRNMTPIFRLNGQQYSDRNSASASFDFWPVWQWENTLQYNKAFGKHDLGLLAGTTARYANDEHLNGSKYDLIMPNFENAYINVGSSEEDMRAGGWAGHDALLSFFGRLSYNYDEKYLLEAVMRADGSSKFGANNRFGYFPAVSAGWVLSEESFLVDNDLISFLKLRASWGQNGSDKIGRYAYTTLINLGNGYTFGNGTEERFINGAASQRLPNPDLKWETSEQLDIGIDLRLLNDRLTVTADFYNKETKDLLVTAPVPAHLGNPAPIVNGGNVLNRGIELGIDFRNNYNDLEYSAGFNISYNKNEVTSIANSEGIIHGAGVHTFGEVARAQVGYPIAYFYGYKTDGIFQNTSDIEGYVGPNGDLVQPAAKPGDVRFVDLNEDGVIDANDRTMIGNPTPDFTYGFNFSADYKGFDLSMLVQGAYGNELLRAFERKDMLLANMPASAIGRWTEEGSSNTLPRLANNDENYNWARMSDLYVEDGSYARLKNIQIGYTLLPKDGKLLGLKKARVYISAENLLTITNYSGFDPEVGARDNNPLDVGIDRGIYPQARTFLLGANITF